MIEILNYERANKNKLIGYVDIHLPKWGMIFRRIAHFKDGQKSWFRLPSFIKEGDSQKEYPAYWEFKTQMHNSQLLEALHEPVKAYCEKYKIADVIPLDFDEDKLEDIAF
jgi:hypothetical protein